MNPSHRLQTLADLLANQAGEGGVHLPSSDLISLSGARWFGWTTQVFHHSICTEQRFAILLLLCSYETLKLMAVNSIHRPPFRLPTGKAATPRHNVTICMYDVTCDFCTLWLHQSTSHANTYECKCIVGCQESIKIHACEKFTASLQCCVLCTWK